MYDASHARDRNCGLPDGGLENCDLLLLVSLVGELAVTNRRLSEIKDAVPPSVETDIVEKKLDQIHQDLEDLWMLTNEMVRVK